MLFSRLTCARMMTKTTSLNKGFIRSKNFYAARSRYDESRFQIL